MKLKPYQTKTLFHSAMSCAALIEYLQAKDIWRKLLCGAFAGFHIAAALVDWKDPLSKF